MPRIKIKKEDQIRFFEELFEKTGFDRVFLSKHSKICCRTLLDWRKGKSTISESAFKNFLRLAKGKIYIPKYKILPDFWSVCKAGKKGGIIIAKKYGGPGTATGRKKGGLISQEKRRLYPELYPNCNLPKSIFEPENSANLAEFMGIMLGDGSIGSETQSVITLHKESKQYIAFVCKLIKNLFLISPAVYHSNSKTHENVVSITVSSTPFIKFLLASGLKKGNKVKQQVDVPNWIKVNKKFSQACLRGLIDTDGCIYSHLHKSHNCNCFNIGLNFSNKSVPLLKFVYNTLTKLKFHPKIFSNGVNLYREPEVCRYAKEIGFHNTHKESKLNYFLKKKYS